MRSLLLVCMVIYGVKSIFGISVVIKKGTVYVDESPIDLQKAEKLEDTPMYTRYVFKAGDTNITITKMKVGKGISVTTSSKMTPEEAAKAIEFSNMFSEKITKKVEKIQHDVDQQFQNIRKKMNEHFNKLVNQFPSFPTPFF